MTTITQIKGWTRPLLNADDQLVLVGRNLVLRPVRHLIRGLYIDRTSRRLQPRLIGYVQPLFDITDVGGGLLWTTHPPVYQTDEDEFESHFRATCQDCLDQMKRIETIDDFLAEVDKTDGRTFGPVPIHLYKLRHPVVLAALGKFQEALSILGPELRDQELTYAGMLAVAQARLAKKPRNGVAHSEVEHAVLMLQWIDALKPLVPLLEAGDSAGISRLLRRHEARNAAVWKVAKLWERTSFPFEPSLSI